MAKIPKPTELQTCPILGCNATFSYAEAFAHYGQHGVFSNEPVVLPEVKPTMNDEDAEHDCIKCSFIIHELTQHVIKVGHVEANERSYDELSAKIQQVVADFVEQGKKCSLGKRSSDESTDKIASSDCCKKFKRDVEDPKAKQMICDTKLTEPKIEPEDADCEDPKKEESSSEALSWLYSGYTKLSIECPACGASFTDAVEMTSHVNQVHLELEEGRKMKLGAYEKALSWLKSGYVGEAVDCPECEERFYDERLLRQHVFKVHLHLTVEDDDEIKKEV